MKDAILILIERLCLIQQVLKEIYGKYPSNKSSGCNVSIMEHAH